jgi:glutamine cyclotransferase
MPNSTPGTKFVLKRTWWFALPIFGLILFALISSLAMPGDDPAPMRRVRIVAAYPHDANAFTQGLAVEGDVLYEGTGHYAESTLRQVELRTGKTQKSMQLPAKYFGEGITIVGDRIYQITWKENTCFVYDKQTLQFIEALRYTGEGWGLTDDETHIYLSDGTSTIRVLDPKTFRTLRRIRVKLGRRSLDKLNELEFVDGEIYANIWYSDQIARIDPQSGEVLGWIDCSNLYPARQRPDREHVFNGIAYDQAAKRMFVTGKNWPQLFEIEVQE